MNRDTLKQELTRDEGLRLKAYQDTRGFWTIGVGHLLGSRQRMSDITEREALALLEVDIEDAEALARSLVDQFDNMNDARQRALVNMAFNRGSHLTTSAKILPAIQRAALSNSVVDWAAVRDAIDGTPWAQQVGKRAERLAAMFATGA